MLQGGISEHRKGGRGLPGGRGEERVTLLGMTRFFGLNIFSGRLLSITAFFCIFRFGSAFLKSCFFNTKFRANQPEDPRYKL